MFWFKFLDIRKEVSIFAKNEKRYGIQGIGHRKEIDS